MVSCQKGPTRHAYALQIGPFWQDTLDVSTSFGNDLAWKKGDNPSPEPRVNQFACA